MGNPNTLKSLAALKAILPTTKNVSKVATSVRNSNKVPLEEVLAYSTANKVNNGMRTMDIYNFHNSEADLIRAFTHSPLFLDRLKAAFPNDEYAQRAFTAARDRALLPTWISFQRSGYKPYDTPLGVELKGNDPTSLKLLITSGLVTATSPFYYGFALRYPNINGRVPYWLNQATVYNQGIIDKALRAPGSTKKFTSDDYRLIRDEAMTKGNHYLELNPSKNLKFFTPKGWSFLQKNLLGGAGAAALADYYFDDPTKNVNLNDTSD